MPVLITVRTASTRVAAAAAAIQLAGTRSQIHPAVKSSAAG